MSNYSLLFRLSFKQPRQPRQILLLRCSSHQLSWLHPRGIKVFNVLLLNHPHVMGGLTVTTALEKGMAMTRHFVILFFFNEVCHTFSTLLLSEDCFQFFAIVIFMNDLCLS